MTQLCSFQLLCTGTFEIAMIDFSSQDRFVCLILKKSLSGFCQNIGTVECMVASLIHYVPTHTVLVLLHLQFVLFILVTTSSLMKLSTKVTLETQGSSQVRLEGDSIDRVALKHLLSGHATR